MHSLPNRSAHRQHIVQHPAQVCDWGKPNLFVFDVWMGGCLVEDWPVGFPTLWDWWVYTLALAIASKTTMNSTMPPINIVYRGSWMVISILWSMYTPSIDCILHLQLLILASQPQVLHICSVLRNNHAASCLTCYTTCMLIQISFKKMCSTIH